jgi:predicted alpha/beta-fold hydrolase
MSWLLGYHSMSFHSAQTTVRIPLKDTREQETRGQPLSLLDLSQAATPPCRLNPFLFNGHLSTIWTAVTSYDIPITYKRRIFESDSQHVAGTFAVDFVITAESSSCDSVSDSTLPPRTTYYSDSEFATLGSDDEKPMVIVLHGLAGGSHEIYLRSVLKPLCLDPPDSQKWWCVLPMGCNDHG